MIGTPDREEVFAALFELINGVEWDMGTEAEPDVKTFITRERRIRLFSDVPSAEQPWLGQAEHGERSSQTSGQPYSRVWAAKWMIYHQDAKLREAIPTITNNRIISALELAMQPSVTDPGYFENRNTLSGRVYHCYIDGEIFKDPGDIDGQALIIVPISILVP